MKKTLLSLVSLLPFTLLASCSSANTKLPNSGKNISAEEGRQKLANSIENTIEEDNKPLDAIGFEVNDSHSKTELTGYMKNADTSILDLNVDLTLKKGEFKAGFKGLNATDPNGIKFLLSVGSEINGSINITSSLMPGVSMNSEYKGLYEAALGIEKKNLYFDLSNKQTYSLISQFANIDLGVDIGSLLPSSGKGKIALPFDDSFTPIGTDALTSIQEGLGEIVNGLPKDGQFKDHNKGVFSYSGELKGNALSSYLNPDEETELDHLVKLQLSADSSFEYSLIFTEDGLASFGYEYKVSGNIQVRLDPTQIEGLPTLGMNDLTLSLTMDLSSGSKFSFLTNDAITFPAINLDDYTEITLD